MSLATKKIAPQETLHQVVRRCIAETDGLRVAQQNIIKELSTRPDLKSLITEPLIPNAVWDLVSQANREGRGAYFARSCNEDNTDGIRHVANSNWYDYKLKNGLRLGDAVLADILDMEQTHNDMAKTNYQRAQFFAELASRMKGRKKLSSQISEKEIDGIACGTLS